MLAGHCRAGITSLIPTHEGATMTEPGRREPSRTAAGVAWLRAAHQSVDGQPKILDDPIAPLLPGERGRLGLIERRDELFTPGALGLRAHVLLRSRFAEDQLALAVARGIRQYVLLGAGLDTFAYRQPYWAAAAEPVLRIFEVDQPASQQIKRERVAAANIPVPGNLTYAAVDFEHEPLLAGLTRTGVATSEPAFFSWLGVSMYLTEKRWPTSCRQSAPSRNRPSWCSPSHSRGPRGRRWPIGPPQSANPGSVSSHRMNCNGCCAIPGSVRNAFWMPQRRPGTSKDEPTR